MDELFCDVCGKCITDSFYCGQSEIEAGNCPECGRDLCKDCAVSWDGAGYCKECSDRFLAKRL